MHLASNNLPTELCLHYVTYESISFNTGITGYKNIQKK